MIAQYNYFRQHAYYLEGWKCAFIECMFWDCDVCVCYEYHVPMSLVVRTASAVTEESNRIYIHNIIKMEQRCYYITHKVGFRIHSNFATLV